MDWNEIKFFRPANYSCSALWNYIEDWVKQYNINLDPDYQRGHVWTERQQIAFVEYCLQGGLSGHDIYWNSPGWGSKFTNPVSIVDGKQRFTAVREFMGNRLKVFGHFFNEFDGKFPTMDRRTMFTMHINNLETRKEVVEWYLAMNTGGSIHTQEEIERVRLLLESADGE